MFADDALIALVAVLVPETGARDIREQRGDGSAGCP